MKSPSNFSVLMHIAIALFVFIIALVCLPTVLKIAPQPGEIHLGNLAIYVIALGVIIIVAIYSNPFIRYLSFKGKQEKKRIKALNREFIGVPYYLRLEKHVLVNEDNIVIEKLKDAVVEDDFNADEIKPTFIPVIITGIEKWHNNLLVKCEVAITFTNDCYEGVVGYTTTGYNVVEHEKLGTIYVCRDTFGTMEIGEKCSFYLMMSNGKISLELL